MADVRFETKGFQSLLGLIADNLIVEEHLTNETEIQLRKDTCWDCPFMNKEKKICNICKCILKIKTKSLTNYYKGDLQVTHCPKGKWDDLEIAKHYNNYSLY